MVKTLPVLSHQTQCILIGITLGLFVLLMALAFAKSSERSEVKQWVLIQFGWVIAVIAAVAYWVFLHRNDLKI